MTTERDKNTAPSPRAVDWSTQGLKRDLVYGAGALPIERKLAFWTGAAGTAVLLAYVAMTDPTAWNIWQYLLAGVLAFDLLGGVVANGLNSAKRAHFALQPAPQDVLDVILRTPTLFTALHIQPIIIGLLYPGAAWWWGFTWYAVTLAAVVAVRRVDLYLQRPVALLACTAVALTAPAIPAPTGFQWVPVVLVLKLVLAHAVQEEPYRPQKDDS